MIVGLGLVAEIAIIVAIVIFSFVVVSLGMSWVMDRAAGLWDRRRDKD